MIQQQVWVGLDVGLRRTHVCVVDDAGATVHEEECETALAPLESALSAFPTDRIASIALEAGSDVHIARKLRTAGFPVTIFEARKASKFLAVRRNKTDAGDARGLADLARLGRNTVSEVYLKSLECEQLRSALVMRKRLVLMRVMVENVLRSRFACYGRTLKRTRAAAGPRAQIDALVAGIKSDIGIDLTPDVTPLLDVWESLSTYLKKLNSDIEKQASANEVCRRLMEVPGVGPICALSFYTAIEDPTRFQKPADVGAYLGLVPRRYQSGEVSRTLGITKSGSKLTRSHLVTAAICFGRSAPDCALKQWHSALHERLGGKRAAVALARKLAILLLIIWKNKTHFELRTPAANADPAS